MYSNIIAVTIDTIDYVVYSNSILGRKHTGYLRLWICISGHMMHKRFV